MSKDKSTRASRAPAQTVINANGTESSIRWVRQATIEKRIRRGLALQGKSLLKTRIGTTAYRELGEFAVLNSKHEVELKLVNLRLLATNLGVLADDERIDPPSNRGWLFHVARSRTEVIDGKRIIINEQLTGEFTTEKAARKSAEGITDQEGLVVVGWDSRRYMGAAESEGGIV